MVIIRPGQTRNAHFGQPSPAQTLRGVGVSRVGPRLEGLSEGVRDGTVRIASPDGSIEALVEGRPSRPEDFVRSHDALRNGVLILPPDFRVESRHARYDRNVRPDVLVNATSNAVKRRLLGREDVPSGDLSGTLKRQYDFTVEAGVRTGFDILGERERLDQDVIGYRFGSNVVTFMQAVLGATMRAYQNFAAWKHLPEEFDRQLRTGRDRDGRPFNARERRTAVERLDRLLKHRDIYTSESELRGLEIAPDDLIEVVNEPHWRKPQHLRPAMAHHWETRVFSRDRPGEAYGISYDDMCVISPEDRQYETSLPWTIRCSSNVEHERFHGYVRGSDLHWTANAIAGAHSIEYKTNHSSKTSVYVARERRFTELPLMCPSLPFIIPTGRMMDDVHALLYKTLLAEFDAPGGKWGLRTLNQHEIDLQIGRIVVSRGFSECFSTSRETLRSRGDNPQRYLVQVDR